MQHGPGFNIQSLNVEWTASDGAQNKSPAEAGPAAARTNGRPASTDGSGRLEIDGLQAAGVLLDLEANLLAIGEITQIRAFHRRDVNEDVLRPVLWRDEAETLGRVEEFYGSCSHVGVVLS